MQAKDDTNPSSSPRPHFLSACLGLPHDRVPVWFMRQAGRSLPEYRKLRGTGSILEFIADAATATEITLQPVRRYGVDAAILFSDIMVPPHAVGFGVDIQPGVGPVVAEPFSNSNDLERLRPLEASEDISYVLETVRLLQKELPVPLIGFAGAPFTVASYLIEGGPSRNFTKTKALMLGDPPLWHALMERLCDITVSFLRAQAQAGVDALQLFDSWAGALDPDTYSNFVLPYTKGVFSQTEDLGLPRICYGVGCGELLEIFSRTGVEVVGVDWRVPLDVARQRVANSVSLQGNLDPAVCLCEWQVVAEHARDVLRQNAGHPAYVFNLGHGVLPETNPEILEKLVELVHAEGKTQPSG